MGAFLAHQGSVASSDGNIHMVQLSRGFDAFIDASVVCDGTGRPCHLPPCLGACCVHKRKHYQVWFVLADLDDLLLHDRQPTSSIVDFFGIALSVLLLRTYVLRYEAMDFELTHQRGGMFLVYTDKKELLGTMLKVFSSNKALNGITVSFWIWALILMTAAAELLRNTGAVLRIQQIQSAGVVVRRHRWYMPPGWLDPHATLQLPEQFCTLKTSIIGSCVRNVLQDVKNLSSLDGLQGMLRRQSVRVTAAALSLTGDVVALDFENTTHSAQ